MVVAQLVIEENDGSGQSVRIEENDGSGTVSD